MTKQEKDSKLAEISHAFLSEYDNAWKEIYAEIEQGWDFLGGKQYTDEQITYYRKKKRPTNVFNNYLPIFTQTLGFFLEAQNRLNVHPKRSGDAFAASRLEDVLNHFEDDEDTRDELAKVLISGMIRIGWVHADWTSEREIDGSLVVENVDEFDVLFDSRTRNDMLLDGKYLLRSRWLDDEDIKRLWPQRRSELKTVLRDKEQDGWIDAFDSSVQKDLTNPEYRFRDQYRVLEFHELVYEPVRVAMDMQTGESEILSLEGNREKLYLQSNPQVRIVERVAKVKRVTECIPGLHFFLDHYKSHIQDGVFDYIPYWSYNLGRDTVNNFGVHRVLVGPQKQLNDAENVTLDLWNKQANVGDNIKPSGIKNYREYKSYGKEPGFDLEIEDNYPISDVIQQRKPPTLPSGALTLADRYKEWMHITSNARENFMGTSETANENATLFANRVREAEKGGILSMRGYQRMRRTMAKKQLLLVQQNLTLEKYFLITSSQNDDEQDVMRNMQTGQTVLNSMKTGEYDVVIDNQSLSQTERRLRFLEKLQLIEKLILPAFGAAGIPWRNFLEDSELGDIEDWIEVLEGLMAQQGDEGEEAKSMAKVKELLAMAQQKQNLEYEGGFPMRPAQNNNVNADSR